MPTGRGLLLLLALIGGAAVVRRWLDVVEVRGRSMAPALEPGDRLLVVRASRIPRIGDVVLGRDPRDAGRELIKRVADVGPQGVVLHGDNPSASTDARTFGTLAAASVRWRVLGRYWPARRLGRVARGGTFDEGGEAACSFPEALIAGEAPT